MAFTSEDTIAIDKLVGPLMLDCPYPIVVQGILQAAIEFCEKTRVWANTQSRTLAAGIQRVTLAPEDDGLITAIDDVTWEGAPLAPIRRSEVSTVSADARKPVGYYRPNPETLALAPATDSHGLLKLSLYLTPTREAATLPRMLYDQYGDALECGALWRLMKIPNRPWSDPEQSLFHKQQFDYLCGLYSLVADKDGTRQPLRTASSF